MNDYILIVLAVAFVFIFLLYLAIHWYRRYLREHEELELLKRKRSEKKVVLVSAKILENSFDGWLENFGYEKRTSGLFVPIIFDPSNGRSYPVEINYRVIAEANYFQSRDNLPFKGSDVIWTDFQIPRFEYVEGVCGQIELMEEPYSFRGISKKPK